MTVAAFESRRAEEMAALIQNFGGVPLVAPSVREVPLSENSAAFAFAEKLFAGEVTAVICMTGVGTRTLLDALQTRWTRAEIVKAFAQTTVMARGPKPIKVLREWAIPVTIAVPEPNTWREVLLELDQNPRGFALAGSRIAVQEYGISNLKFLEELRQRGAEVMPVPVYRWTLPEDLGPLRNAVNAIVAGKVHATLFTNATQVYHLLEVAGQMGCRDDVRAKMRSTVVGSIGPACTEALLACGIPVDMEPQHAKMGALVHEAAERIVELMEKKSRAPASRPAQVQENALPAGLKPGATPPWHESRFLKACRREPVDATPIWLMRQAGRYMKEYREVRARVPFLELCKNPALVSEVTVTAAERLKVDAAIIFADLLLIVEPLGFELEYDTGEGPVISPRLRKAADVGRLREVNPEESLAYHYEAIRQTRADLNPRIPLIGFAGAPFTLASYLIEGGGSKNYRHTKTLMYSDPGAWRALMEHLARSLARYVNAQIAAGVQAVQVFDSWVGCLGPEDYREYVLPYSRLMIEALTPGAPVIHFGTGNPMLLTLMREAGGDVIGVDSKIELDEAWARIGYDRGIQGNLDPVVLYADRAYIKKRVERILHQAGGRPGHIFNLGHGILPETPVENVIALVEMVRELSGR
jgi:uroporphyrinogen decarboxylase